MQRYSSLFIVCSLCLLVIYVHTVVSQDICSSNTTTTCHTCVSTNCVWCSQTSRCVSPTEQCLNATIIPVGEMGIRDSTRSQTKFWNQLGVNSKSITAQQSALLNSCFVRIESIDQCVTGSEYAKIYLPVSGSSRNLQSGGLAQQPILPVPHEFLLSYVNNIGVPLKPDMTKKELKKYMDHLADSKTSHLLVGSYLINNDQHKNAQALSLFSHVGYIGFTANYTLDPKRNNKLTVKKKSKGNVMLHLLPSSISLHAPRGKYQLGMVVAFVTNDTQQQPQCLFYQVPDPITVKPVYQDVLVGIYVYIGIPVFLIAFILVVIYSACCPFNDIKKVGQARYDEQEKQEREDLKNKNADPTIDTTTKPEVDEEAMAQTEPLSGVPDVTQTRAKFSLLYFLKVNSDVVIEQCGLRGYYYWKFYRRLLLIVTLYAFLALSIILPINIVFNHRGNAVIDLAVTTFGTIGRFSAVSSAHYIVSVVFFVIAVAVYAFSIRLTYYKRRYEASIFTARLRHLPELEIKVDCDSDGKCFILNHEEIDKRETLLVDHFNTMLKKELSMEQQQQQQQVEATNKDDILLDNGNTTIETKVEDPVLSVSIIADMEHVMSDIEQQHKIEANLASQASKGNSKTFLQKVRLKRLKKARASMMKKIKKKPIVTSQVFITFRSAHALRTCKKIYKDYKKKMSCNTEHSDNISMMNLWKMRQVTWEPEDVQWENIYDSTRRNVFGTVFVYLVYLVFYLIVIGLMVLYIIRYGLYGVNAGLHFKQAYLTMDSSVVTRKFVPLGLGFTGSIFSVTLTIAGEIANVIIRVVTSLERMKSKSKTSASYLLKSVAIIIPFYMTVPFLGDYKVSLTNAEAFYNNVGLNLMQFVLSYAFFYKGIELLICVVKVTISYWMTGGEPERIPFDFNVAYTSALTIFFIVAVTGVMVPLLFIPAVIFFFISYLVDTMLLLFFYDRAVGTGRIEFGLVSALLMVFGAAAMLFHPSTSWILLIGSLVFIGTALSIIAAVVYIYNIRGKKRSTQVHVHEETVYAHKYTQPHLERLMKKVTDYDMHTMANMSSDDEEEEVEVEKPPATATSTPITPV
jgi:hypothetical protein